MCECDFCLVISALGWEVVFPPTTFSKSIGISSAAKGYQCRGKGKMVSPSAGTSFSDDFSDGEAADNSSSRVVPIAEFLTPDSLGGTKWRWSQLTPSHTEGEGGQAVIWSCQIQDSEMFCVKIAKVAFKPITMTLAHRSCLGIWLSLCVSEHDHAPPLAMCAYCWVRMRYLSA
jgi:hypothetical protein